MDEQSGVIDLWRYERQFYDRGLTRVAGVDEVGRGPLAGPVVACAVILPDGFDGDGIDDSKILTAERRLKAFPQITDNCLAWAVGCVDVETIDKINILQASLLAMRMALDDLPMKPEAVIVDGNHKIPQLSIPQIPVVKGDSRSISVACASILAKEIRDRIMEDLDREYPGFGFGSHKGYATPEHIRALTEFGPVSIHRKSFRSIRLTDQQQLDFE